MEKRSSYMNKEIVYDHPHPNDNYNSKHYDYYI